MAELNNPGCVLVLGANTGVPGCDFAPDKFVGAILIDKSTIIEDADIPDIITKLQELTLATGRDRIHPIFRFEEITDNSEEETIATLGYGSKQVVKEGKYDWMFRIVKGGLCLNNKLRSFNKANKKVLFVDSSNVIYGTRVEGGITGFTMDFFYAKPFKANDASNAAIFNVRFALAKPEEFNEKVAFVKADQDIEEAVKGLIDLELVELAVATGKVTVGIRTACDKVDLYPSFDDALAAGELWKVTKAGANVAITSVAKNDTAGGWDVSFTGTGEHVITLAAPSVLAAANVGGYPENGFEAGILTSTLS
ncbi:hypothetical protein SDC9_36971 [bioreactor metagenome]|uniref:Uncharacterized protein n=1 Tax=bioreactor metagenome TaxID=1076179 RepID=A0A644VJY5_9ZZZZ|nr:hypothetical protein [Lentimicrobium sp.]MEA5110374.1 hypothetical protein [Lentimicrobium sp.]